MSVLIEIFDQHFLDQLPINQLISPQSVQRSHGKWLIINCFHHFGVTSHQNDFTDRTVGRWIILGGCIIRPIHSIRTVKNMWMPQCIPVILIWAEHLSRPPDVLEVSLYAENVNCHTWQGIRSVYYFTTYRLPQSAVSLGVALPRLLTENQFWPNW